MSIHVKVERDDSPQNPREDFDSPSTMACWHRSYTLGDTQPTENPGDWLRLNAPEGSAVLNLYLYDHSGITISCEAFSCSFDSGWVGFLVCTPDTIQKEWDGDKAKAEAYLRGEVATYDQYLTGDCWGFIIEEDVDECPTCHHTPERDHVDSCWGFFGDSLDAMKDHVDAEYHAALDEAWSSR